MLDPWLRIAPIASFMENNPCPELLRVMRRRKSHSFHCPAVLICRTNQYSRIKSITTLKAMNERLGLSSFLRVFLGEVMVQIDKL